jgi:lantibiotic modifying enzyme
MIISKAEIDGIVKEAAGSDASAPRSTWSVETRRLLGALPDFDFGTKRMTPLAKLCAAGADYGWRKLERSAGPVLAADLSAKAKASLRRHLRRDLEEITRPCLDLELKSFGLAMSSLGLTSGKPDSKSIERMFLRDKPSHRLLSLFKKFPVLARLWCQLICQWREHVREVFARFAADRRALSRTFFGNQPIGRIANTRFSLSDRHNSGRTVARLQFQAGSIIYKPRSGKGESEWFSLLDWMNGSGFQPKLLTARVLPRKGYCWMEDVEPASCKNKAAARRFYERIGGIIAAAHLLKLVDCHRDNLIASGEHPVLVDIDALWHVSPPTKTQSLSDVLYRTGFFPNANPRSLQSRSSALGPGTTGNHLPRLGGKPLLAADYQREIARGFAGAWRCILGTSSRRNAFARRLRRIRSRERRWIYWATEKYAAIREASLEPAILRSDSERDLFIRSLCARGTVPSVLIDAESRALKQLDIPYFVRRTNENVPSDKLPVPGELIKAIRRVVPDISLPISP